MKCSLCAHGVATEGYKTCAPCRERQAAYMRRYLARPENLARHRARQKEYYRRPAVRERTNEQSRARNLAIKVEVIGHYGGTCVCCGVTEIKFLTLDHPNDDGGQHRAQLGVKAGLQFYKKIRRLGYPLELIVLCFNCHMVKKYGTCPHQEEASCSAAQTI